ncbi:MAG: tRNA (N6-isopentenyl adenosine(37)-C2)-methylthiotransferase MiaB [Bacilli bacterium]|nr:tRNA (N6-isopentenyl adenosine(37)-C2)-methylthiotransferase MiaB [Bacilli bacterium]
MSKILVKSLANQKEATQKVENPVRIVDDGKVTPRLLGFGKDKLFYIRTYGCQANIRDEEIMAGYLNRIGMKRTINAEEADLAIINTCAVRENAEAKIYGEIGSFKANYERNKNFMLVIAGCVMEENGVAQELMATYSWISLIIGTHDVPNLLPLLDECLKSKKNIINVRSFAGEVVENMPSMRISPYKAYVNISYGCDKFCTYCIVPYTRGRERSRKMEDILKECQELVNDGYKEITLLGQNVNSYGLDFKDGTTFAHLLEAVAKTGIPQLKFLTSYPSQFSDEMIEIMAKYPNIVHWLHFPVQSGSTNVLSKMGRRYSREEYVEIARKIKAKMPDIGLTTDIIVGFPKETEEDFLDTLSLCKEIEYSAAFTFIYSPRSGTPAARMEQVPEEIQHERFDRLKAVIEDSTAKHSASMVGKIYDILVDGPSKKDENILSGYATNGKLVNFPGPKYLTGCIVKVKMVESHVYYIKGELAEDPIIAKARDVAYLISLDPVVKEYQRLDETLRNSDEIKALGDKLVLAKKNMVLSKGSENYPSAKKDYEDVLNEIKNHPLLNNRDNLSSEVEDLLITIRNILK